MSRNPPNENPEGTAQGPVEATKPYKSIGFGAMEVTKPYKFTGFAQPRMSVKYSEAAVDRDTATETRTLK